MSMKIALLGFAASMSYAASGFAADLPSSAPPPVYAPPLFTWTGFYVGVNAGVSFGRNSFEGRGTGAWIGNPIKPAVDAVSSGKSDRTNFTGGAQIGYNYQVGSFVVGVEGDIGYFSNRKTTSSTAIILGNPVNVTTRVGAGDYLGTARARVGYAFDRLLIYATGGVAVAETRTSQRIFFAATNTTAFGSGSHTRVGYAVGGGAEYALTNNWSVKGEYLYVNLRDTHRNLFNPGFPTFTHRLSATNRDHIVRVGLNYKF